MRPKIRRPIEFCVFGRFGRLSLAAVHTADCRFDSGVNCWFHISSIVIYLWRNSFLLRWNNCKQCSESTTNCCFWSTVSKRCTHFEHGFLSISCKIVTTLPSDIFNSAGISRNLFVKGFFVSSGTTAEVGRPECSASFVSVWPRFKLAYYLLTMVSLNHC